jgi:hypothetical protein
VLGTFKPFKSAGTNEIVLALLQQGTEHLVLHLCHIFRACLAYGFTPLAWRQVKVTFIPKPRKSHYTDIEGAFDRTSFGITTQAAETHGTKPTICRWISSMLESRNIITTLLGETMRASTTRGCSQGGVLSPLLYSLVVGELLWEFNDNDYYTVGYVDDSAILINGKFPWTVSESYKQLYA